MKKRSILFPAIFLCSLLLVSCGGGENGENGDNGKTGENGEPEVPARSMVAPGMGDLKELTERTEYYDIIAQSTEFSRSSVMNINPNGDFCSYRDTVLYGEEAVQIWESSHEDGTEDIWLYRADESWELLLSGISKKYISQYSKYWYLDSEGNSYCWNNVISRFREDGGLETIRNVILTKFLPSGEVQFSREWDSGDSISGICQLQDGSIYLYLMDSEGSQILAELDPVTGETPEEKKIKLDDAYKLAHAGSSPEALLLFYMDPVAGDMILAVSPEDGQTSCLLNFTGTSYANVYSQMSLADFKMLPDGSFLMLYKGINSLPQAALDKLMVSRVEKTPIVFRGHFGGDPWISAQAARFNRQSEKYHVIIEDSGRGNGQEELARLTSVQIAAGKGPDIIQERLMEDYLWGMLKNGALEELSPYLERSGVREEDYFPAAFGIRWEEDRIYGMVPIISWLGGYMMDASLLGTEEPDIEELVDALLSLEKTDAVFLADHNSQDLLEYFLGGSETLWGMVDWEEGICDFGGELFTAILEAAAQYGDSSRNSNPAVIAETRFHDVVPCNLITFQGSREMERAGKAVCGSLFDDGCHMRLFSGNAMAINSNSKNKEGAWEFILSLFDDEVQLYDDSYIPCYIPVRRDCLDKWLEAQLDKVRGGRMITRPVWEKTESGEDILMTYSYTDQEITEEKAAEFKRELEEARALPLRTQVILEFIREEAEDYFNGSKTAEDVIKVITSRVQVYLDENR